MVVIRMRSFHITFVTVIFDTKNKIVKNFIFISIVALVISACHQGIEESTVKAIAELETEWLELGQQSLNWNKELKTTLENCDLHKCPLDSVSEDNDSIVICPCLKEKDVMNSLLVECDVFQRTWVEATTSFETWRSKIPGGKIDDIAANNSLDEFKTLFDTEKDKLQSWIAAYNESKENYLDNCAVPDTLQQ